MGNQEHPPIYPIPRKTYLGRSDGHYTANNVQPVNHFISYATLGYVIAVSPSYSDSTNERICL